jgi:hypothetical protein
VISTRSLSLTKPWKPLSDQALEAITQLAKASEDNKRKKKLKKKEEDIGGN